MTYRVMEFRVDQAETAGGGRHLVPDSKTIGLQEVPLPCLLLYDLLDVGSPLLPVVEAVYQVVGEADGADTLHDDHLRREKKITSYVFPLLRSTHLTINCWYF